MSEITQEEAQANHDTWWNSLTDEQKQQLYSNQEKAFELTIEEMNYNSYLKEMNNESE